ncbi:hypothetical protein [Nocardioides sp. YIM 152588]|uniref:hypothetical protein n=1 Tax=Nocardioides sp. YIM 152588 TaxID=3158259 RepID=UPI0032E458E1
MFAEPDSDTFLTAFFQGGATLVAIVAGIIGARFVAAHGDVQGRRDRSERLRLDEQSLQAKSERAAGLARRRRAERRACSAQFLSDYVLSQDPQLIERKVESMDPRIREFFRQSVERIDDFLPTCNELVERWGPRPLSIGTLRQEGAPVANSFSGSVYAHVVLERARQQCEASTDHTRKFLNLSDEVAKRDAARHRLLQSEIERALERESSYEDELGTVRRQQAELRNELDILEAGEGFRLGLRVLALIASLVIAPPVALLLFRPTDWGDRWPASAVALLFAAGIAVMLRYLYVYSGFIQGRSALPEAARDLVLPRRWWGNTKT